MTPRVIMLIIIGTVVYVLLSLYHWGQVKKIPRAEKQNSVRSVLTGQTKEKNWVQVTTSPGLPGGHEKKLAQAEPALEGEQTAQNPAQPSTDSLSKIPSPAESITANPWSQELQAVRSENSDLRKNLQQERSVNLRQSQEMSGLQTKIISLQSALEDTSIRQQNKNITQKNRKKQSGTPPAESADASPEDSRTSALKKSLLSKTDALAKANERITGLAERLNQSRRALAEAEDTSAHLQRILSDTEMAKIKARKEADKLNDQLNARDKIIATLRQELDSARQAIADHDRQQKDMEPVVSGLKDENKRLQEIISEAANSSRKAMEINAALDQETMELTEKTKPVTAAEGEGLPVR